MHEINIVGLAALVLALLDWAGWTWDLPVPKPRV